MATYAIGDIQGCFDSLQHLLEKCRFDPASDRLWLVGDLVNRGPRSLDTLRFVRDLGSAAITVLGNHDLYLLMVAAGSGRRSKGDTLDEILKAADCEELLDWLRQRPLCHREGEFCMVHAGLLAAMDNRPGTRAGGEKSRLYLVARPTAISWPTCGVANRRVERRPRGLAPFAGDRQRDDPNALLFARRRHGIQGQGRVVRRAG
jgi:3',5'-cyclic AMP phosphodiesterase CpdA